ncbi:MAG TPA: GNAT family N-acetyltransferase [Thermoanaerobaculia bacterium]|nr:GNAT family N-acetyltransferase [Thermoanaerobaculia bacterium]
MFDLRHASPDEVEQLRAIFDRASDAPYPIVPVFDEKLLAGTAGRAEITVATREGEVVAGMVCCGAHLRLLAVSRGHRNQGAGTRLLALAERHAAASGFERLIIAGEPGNYFTPGIWLNDERTIGFFRARGYRVRSEPVNLTVQLNDSPFLDQTPPTGRVVGASHEERMAVKRWIEDEFGPIWAFEAGKSFEHPQPSIFIHREGGEIRGFSAHCANNAALGTYGPAGVGRRWRRNGYGSGLLLASLADLKVRGFSAAIIQWAAALDFYERTCGAVVSERFVVLEKALK